MRSQSVVYLRVELISRAYFLLIFYLFFDWVSRLRDHRTDFVEECTSHIPHLNIYSGWSIGESIVIIELLLLTTRPTLQTIDQYLFCLILIGFLKNFCTTGWRNLLTKTTYCTPHSMAFASHIPQSMQYLILSKIYYVIWINGTSHAVSSLTWKRHLNWYKIQNRSLHFVSCVFSVWTNKRCRRFVFQRVWITITQSIMAQTLKILTDEVNWTFTVSVDW